MENKTPFADFVLARALCAGLFTRKMFCVLYFCVPGQIKGLRALRLPATQLMLSAQKHLAGAVKIDRARAR